MREMREEAGMTVREVAERAEVTSANVINIENGRYSVGLDVLERISNALGASVEIVKAAH